MLTFLRKIRRSLIESGSTRKYLLYAIGEIALVVIGILIALQINNWNERQKEQIQETKLLVDLKENLEFNVNALKYIISDFSADDGSSNLIISVIEENRPYHDSLDYHFARALNANPLYVLSFVGYESMKNIGFDKVRNDNLKKEIINLFELTYSIAQLRQNRIPDTWNFISKHFMHSSSGWSYMPFDFDSLIKDREFHSWLNRFRSSRNRIGNGYDDALTESQRVLQLIQDELKNRD